jgi:C-terminal processing protease CtpA/Prc
VAAPYRLKTSPPVVVLIDGGTASSGEAVAIAFQGRPRTRFIGSATRGLSSSNEGFELSDGANLVITVGLDVDRTGRSYADQVLPDETIEGPAGAQDEDLQLARALDWVVENG